MFSGDFKWLNRPDFMMKEGELIVVTSPETDFWQRTKYGFRRDNGHAYLVKVDFDFSLTVETRSYPGMQYDQCGLMVRKDSDNWIKASMEYENEGLYRLGSVVTNLGYSDWASLDITGKTLVMWYRIHRSQNDFLVEYSYDGRDWKQLRVTHLLSPFSELEVGIYACSPANSSFTAEFRNFRLENSSWKSKLSG
jgi:uncharacterized protein